MALRNKYPFVNQNYSEDCSIACITMVFRFLVGYISFQTIYRLCQLSNEGLSLRGLLHVLSKLGLKSSAFYAPDNYFLTTLKKPLIAFVNEDHYVVIYKSYSKRGETYLIIADPKYGIKDWKLSSFINVWRGDKDKGILIDVEPTDNSASFIEKPKPIIGNMKMITDQLIQNKYHILYLTFAFFYNPNYSINNTFIDPKYRG